MKNNINILIVNYNTQKLTDACIHSINKTTPNAKIYVFDNSDIETFHNTHKNVILFDNTKSKIINFEEILNKYDNKTSYGAESNFGTLKHTLSVDKCFDLINDNFILLDSDVLVKKDLTEIYDDEYIYVGDVFAEGKSKNLRLSPHICFINVNKSKEKNIRYFDKKRIVGLSKEGDDYDTGSSFYFDTINLKSKKIKEKDYIIHFGAASWARKGSTTINYWLTKNKELWEKNEIIASSAENNLDIFICTHKNFEIKVKSSVYKIVWANEINYDLTNNGLKDDFYSEFYQFKFVNDNIPLKKYVGFCHYRRYFNFFDNIPNMDEIFEKYDAIVGKPLVYKTSVKQQYAFCHNIEDLYIIGGILADKYPQYCKAWHNFLNNKIFFPYNMFIMRKEDFKEYIAFVYDVLDEYVKIVGTDIIKRIEDNKGKYLKNFSPNNTIDYQYRIGGYLGERLTNLFIITHFKKLQAYPIKITEEKYKQK